MECCRANCSAKLVCVARRSLTLSPEGQCLEVKALTFGEYEASNRDRDALRDVGAPHYTSLLTALIHRWHSTVHKSFNTLVYE